MTMKPPSKTYSRAEGRDARPAAQYELRRSTRLVAKSTLNAKTPKTPKQSKHSTKATSPKRHQLSSYYDFVSTP